MRLLNVTTGWRLPLHRAGGGLLAAGLLGIMLGSGAPANAAPAAPAPAAIVATPLGAPGAVVPAADPPIVATLVAAARASASPAVDGHYVYIFNGDNRVELFWRGGDCRLWHNWQLSPAGTTISGRFPVGGCLLPFAGSSHDVAGFRNGDNRLEMVAIGTNNELFHIWQLTAGGAWS